MYFTNFNRPFFRFRLRNRSLFVALAFSTLFFNAVGALAGTITVTSAEDSGAGTLRQAILDAASGDTINFSLPSGTTAIILTSDRLLISKNLTISGPGSNLLSVVRGRATGQPFFHFRIFDITLGSVGISGLTIVNGSPPTNNVGGGIYNSATLRIVSCTIYGNSTTGSGDEGGGIYNSGTLTIISSTVSGNSCQTNGAGIFNDHATLSVTNSTISGNSGNIGGGIYNYGGTMTLTNCTIAGNAAVFAGAMSGGGGGVYNLGGTTSAKNTIFAKNTGASQPSDFDGTLVSQGYNLIGNISGTTITGTTTGNQLNVDPKLGPLQNNGGPTFTEALLSGSPAIDGGGPNGPGMDQRGLTRPVDSPGIANASGGDGSDIGAYEVQADQLPGCGNTIVTNNNDRGAGSLRFIMANLCQGARITFAPSVVSPINLTSGELLIDRPMTISGPGAKLLMVQRDPSASTNFSIFHIGSGGTITISGLTITKGNPQHDGGGIFVDTQMILNLTGCAVTGNSASSAGMLPSHGGGIALSGFSLPTAVIDNSTISGNSATADGGGVFVSGGELDIINSTIAGNAALKSGGGVIPGGTTRIFDSTIANNSAATGGGVRNASGAGVTSRNSIIAKNTASTADPDFSGDLTSQGFNLIGNSSGATITPAQSSDQVGTPGSPIDPLLGPLQNNGGPTPTLALLSGSTAIDQGGSAVDPITGNPIITDQRGFTRPFDNPGIANATGGDGSDIGAFEAQVTLLGNISTRAFVQTGDNVMIGGFIITGSGQKKVILRAIGPSLVNHGITNPLQNPMLELHDGTGAVIASNDNWMDAPNRQEIIDSGLAPGNNLESAILTSLNPGAYTAIVRGVNNGTGIALVEAYDLDLAAGSKLGNISTRALVQTGDNVMIGGFIAVGSSPIKVIVRAIGPSLVNHGITNPLQDPTLELHNGNGAVIASNDNWKDSQQAEIQATGLAPTDDRESAIVRSLTPGNYTAIVRGKNNTTGIALVEVYGLN